jgi:GntR family transcriptional repressor for pyruvate dehydrogenase complex
VASPTPQTTRSRADAAAELLLARIQDGTHPVGSRLPPERILVDELQISRAVLREALSSLEALGLIETRGTRGRFVASGGSSERSRSIVSAWLHQHAQEILEVDEIRSELEAHAILSMSEWDALDAARGAAAVVREQEEALERGDPVAAADGDAVFHRLLSSYTANTALKVLNDGLVDASRKGAYAVYSLPETAQRSLAQHRGIADALAASDVAGAAERARAHMIDVARQYAAAKLEPVGER